MSECSVKTMTKQEKSSDYFNLLFWFDLHGLHGIILEKIMLER